MIDYINSRLNAWAAWRCGSGQSRRSPYPAYNLAGTRDAGDAPPRASYVPTSDLECCETDRCVVALCPALRLVVEAIYLHTSTEAQKCEACACSRATLYRRLHEAHVQLLGYLNDLAAGVDVVPHKIRLTA